MRIGRRGELEIRPGYYLYVGSAFGPGGVHSRVARHCRLRKAKHWHIDYLRDYTTPVAVWYSHAGKRLEHDWAGALARMPNTVAIAGFGCTDCSCMSHLFYSASEPASATLASATRREIHVASCRGGLTE